MTFQFEIAWLLATLLFAARVAGATALTPILGPTQIPAPVRVTFTVALSGLIVAALPSIPAVDFGALQLAIAVIGEVIIGASLAFGFLVAYAATQIAGRTLDVQMGFGAASVLNPDIRTTAPLIGTLLGMLAVAVFLAIDGHHVLIRALSVSLATYPLGQFATDFNWAAFVAQSTAMFAFGLALAAPVMISLLFVDLGMAVMARSMPQLNVFVMSFSVKILLGLLGLMFAVRYSESVLISLFESTFRFWERIAMAT